MSKSIKLKNNTYIDSSGVSHNRENLNLLLDNIINKLNKMEQGRLTATSFSSDTTYLSVKSLYHLTFSKTYTSPPSVIAQWSNDRPTSYGDVTVWVVNITTSGCDIVVDYDISRLSGAYVNYIVSGV